MVNQLESRQRQPVRRDLTTAALVATPLLQGALPRVDSGGDGHLDRQPLTPTHADIGTHQQTPSGHRALPPDPPPLPRQGGSSSSDPTTPPLDEHPATPPEPHTLPSPGGLSSQFEARHTAHWVDTGVLVAKPSPSPTMDKATAKIANEQLRKLRKRNSPGTLHEAESRNKANVERAGQFSLADVPTDTFPNPAPTITGKG